MTERKQALQELRDKVAAGEVHGRCRPAQVAFGPLAKLAWAAQDGSLDAAKALHEAVLPEREWLVRSDDRQGAFANVMTDDFLASPEIYTNDGTVVQKGVLYAGASFIAYDNNPARAWLLCILDALIAGASQ